MSKSLNRHLFFIAILLSSLFAAYFISSVKAETPTSVVLIYYRGVGLNNANRLEWATATEFNTIGFWLERADHQNGPYVRLVDEIGFIFSEGGGVMGGEYEATDTTAVNGQVYWYKLIEVEDNNQENTEPPIAVTTGVAATPTPTATVAATQTPTASPTPTPTHTPTAPATATQTPTATAVGSLPSSASPTPTATTTTAPTARPTNTQTPPATSMPTNVPPTPANQSAPTATATQIAPAATPTTRPAAPPTSTSTSGQVLAQTLPTPTGPSGYPEPENDDTDEPADIDQSPTAEPGSVSPYPEGASDETTSPTLLTTPSNNVQSPAVIGGNQVTPTAPAALTEAGDAGSTGRIFLWIAFLAAILIFIAGVAGSIILFTRQRTAGKS